MAHGPLPAWFRSAADREGIIYSSGVKLFRFDLQGAPAPLIIGAPAQLWPAVGPQGDIKAWYPGNGWKPEEPLAVVNEVATASFEPARVASSQLAAKGLKQP